MTAARRADSPLFGDLLRQHRLALGITQEELAERAGMSIRGISDLERALPAEAAAVLPQALELSPEREP